MKNSNEKYESEVIEILQTAISIWNAEEFKSDSCMTYDNVLVAMLIHLLNEKRKGK